MNYPEDLTKEILEIISKHDTRKSFISINDGLVRDADKLWQFSKLGFKADMKRSNYSFEQLKERLLRKIDEQNFFYSSQSKEIALNELNKRKIS